MDTGFTQRYAKVRPSLPKQFTCRAPSDINLKWLLDCDQDQVLTFSNPALKSAMWGRERKDIKFFIVHWCNALYFSRSEGFICKVINGLRDSAFQFQLFRPQLLVVVFV